MPSASAAARRLPRGEPAPPGALAARDDRHGHARHQARRRHARAHQRAVGDSRRLARGRRPLDAHHRTARTRVDGDHAPDRNDEYLFYQTLIGTWPPRFPTLACRRPARVRKGRWIWRSRPTHPRLHAEGDQGGEGAYELGEHTRSTSGRSTTSWTAPHRPWQGGVPRGVRAVPAPRRPARHDQRAGATHAQNGSPGVVDFYQGNGAVGPHPRRSRQSPAGGFRASPAPPRVRR